MYLQLFESVFIRSPGLYSRHQEATTHKEGGIKEQWKAPFPASEVYKLHIQFLYKQCRGGEAFKEPELEFSFEGEIYFIIHYCKQNNLFSCSLAI